MASVDFIVSRYPSSSDGRNTDKNPNWRVRIVPIEHNVEQYRAETNTTGLSDELRCLHPTIVTTAGVLRCRRCWTPIDSQICSVERADRPCRVREGIVQAHRKPGGHKFRFLRREVLDWLIANRYEPEQDR